MTIKVNDAGTWRTPTTIKVNDAGTWRTIQSVKVNDAGTWRTVYSAFTPTTVSFVGTGSSTYTVPSGATNVVIEVWGAGGAGGTGGFDGVDFWGGGGGGAGGYSRSSYSCSGGQVLNYGAASVSGGLSFVNTGGPVTGSKMNGFGGNSGGNADVFGGVPGAGGTGGNATNGNAANTVGTTGNVGVGGGDGAGAAGTTGVNGGPYGAGGAGGVTLPGDSGAVGAVVFRFT